MQIIINEKYYSGNMNLQSYSKLKNNEKKPYSNGEIESTITVQKLTKKFIELVL